MTDLADAPPHVRPLERYVQLETDHFCDCGYNLHGQIVTRDERLNFMVCRCPECGTWHPAGEGTSARRVWLNRIGLFALFAWILFATCVVLGLLLAMGGMQGLHNATAVEWVQFLPDGTRVEWDLEQGQMVNSVTRQPLANTGFLNIQSRRVFEMQWDRQEVTWVIFLNLVSCLLATSLGGFIAIAGWHVPRRRYLWVALLPIAVAGVVYGLWRLERSHDAFHVELLPWMGWCVALQVIFVLLGTVIGRPLARGLARVFVPPKPRQALAFLWRVDGKTPPPMADAQGATR
ncbi:MAG TPA: hypothetical protein VGN72_01980 [Tepidisphaeraceae bacterium]|jgi:hypothetical protein|nr:hypothetical protein [Tepidisphaeraceae bacterium]